MIAYFDQTEKLLARQTTDKRPIPSGVITTRILSAQFNVVRQTC